MIARQHILVIDDDRTVLDLIEDMLDPYYDVEVSSDPSASLSCLEKQDYDLLIVDLGLPELDGTAIIRQVRSSPRLKDLPIVVMSAYTQLTRRVAGLDVQAVIRKPFHLDNFLDTLRGILQHRSPHSAHTSI